MKIRTVQALRAYLTDHRLSPEQLAREIKVSNMTLRRLLKQPDECALPERYHAHFDLLTKTAAAQPALAPEDFTPLLSNLEEQGAAVTDVNQLQSDTATKLEDPGIGATLRSNVKTIFRAVASKNLSARKRAICLGAILYLLNPIDLIPDTTPVVGYLDDMAVLALAVGSISAGDSADSKEGAASKRSSGQKS